ncbi:septum site-determining protein MinC [Syntrophomonas zehnderi]|uniref:septum site-determining protein MinC n=1 Tax=Syntrophomonas zehnderi TaxID=404335 RepID=UPI0012FAEDC3|nr:septum site-determining protein MinC [Syntrophomonas zehnderi]
MAKLDIKGLNNSLVFVFGEGSLEEYITIIKSKVDNNPQLFAGSSVIFQGDGLKLLTQDELADLQRICLDYDMVLNNMQAPSSPRAEKKPAASRDLIIYKTLRSGQRVHSDASIIVWGNVHESAEITAAKDVIVLGKLEGLAHAGCFGDISSTIFALQLSPRQLRIADRISRSSGDLVKNNYPEIAYVEDDNICIKEYTPHEAIPK